MDVSSDYIVMLFIYLLVSSVTRDTLHARYTIVVWSV